MDLKVLTYNIHKGRSSGRGRDVLAGIRDAIELTHADVVMLQEVHGHESAIQRAQFEFLADRMWPYFAYGRNAIYSGGHHGNAILSRIPIESWENINVSNFKRASRSVLHGVLRHPVTGVRIDVVCCHFGLSRSERSRQLVHLMERICSSVPSDAPLVIGGDFNDWRRHLHGELRADLGLSEAFVATNGEFARTYPAFLPLLPLDRIYYRNAVVRGVSVLSGSPWQRLSDHLPVFAQLDLDVSPRPAVPA